MIGSQRQTPEKYPRWLLQKYRALFILHSIARDPGLALDMARLWQTYLFTLINRSRTKSAGLRRAVNREIERDESAPRGWGHPCPFSDGGIGKIQKPYSLLYQDPSVADGRNIDERETGTTELFVFSVLLLANHNTLNLVLCQFDGTDKGKLILIQRILRLCGSNMLWSVRLTLWQ